MSSLDVDLATKLAVVSALDEYVFGYCVNQRNNTKAGAAPDDTMVAYVEGLLDTGEYPALEALAADLGLEEAWAQVEAHMRDDTRFDRSLGWLLDGIEAGLDRRS